MIDGQGERDARVEDPFIESVQDDPIRAVEEAEPYFPPTDPGVVDTSPVAVSVSGGSPDEALATRIRHDLRADAATSELALEVAVEEGVVTLRGVVSDMQDSDNALEVAGRLPGVVDVVDELEIAAS
ncbi:MAG TPA: BON domain-containing protein [Candidatus Limnocylindrales bacterium]|nr:BON domain-containing protein [Candidatus Limnocylindrales bacterium]